MQRHRLTGPHRTRAGGLRVAAGASSPSPTPHPTDRRDPGDPVGHLHSLLTLIDGLPAEVVGRGR